MSFLAVFNFDKTIAMFEISNLEFFEMQYFLQNKKTLNLELKMPYLGGIFRLYFEKATAMFEINTLEFS